MSSQRRSRLEVIYTILHVLHRLGPLRKTRLMQLVNLNTRSFSTYVDQYLVPLGLVSMEEIGGHVFYSLTPSGSVFYRVLGLLYEAGLLGVRDVSKPPSFELETFRLACGDGSISVLVAENSGTVASLGLASLLTSKRDWEQEKLIVVLPVPGLGPLRVADPRGTVAVVLGARLPEEKWSAIRRAAELLGCSKPLRLEQA